jgi:hypothetical protein
MDVSLHADFEGVVREEKDCCLIVQDLIEL